MKVLTAPNNRPCTALPTETGAGKAGQGQDSSSQGKKKVSSGADDRCHGSGQVVEVAAYMESRIRFTDNWPTNHRKLVFSGENAGNVRFRAWCWRLASQELHSAPCSVSGACPENSFSAHVRADRKLTWNGLSVGELLLWI